MTNLPNPNFDSKPPTRVIHRPSEPLPAPVGYSEPGSTDYAVQDRPGEGTLQQERPLGVQPATQGGVAIGGRQDEDLPMGKATAADKMIGKTQKVAGKMGKNPELHEKGELREAGGKAATTGQARAPHD
ncbi:hypothetical protein AGABI1DRAFT_94308 [Agaricus bisporus var. burnettii JB137-S8]|uniref:Uncharacterized protein n=2 Tax=Agaricus bisporus TaxID=5341 RepID=K5WLN2_AGABU|nr:uncharacterized protein AGABI1DRAFT_94308 [Agaricus bisporus var. burnettii JB137-S8]EKM76206.1 hypothetical protein AGABI1DRAFT_94308 [Agaricus bisporus var. burnettii JB137-S8]